MKKKIYLPKTLKELQSLDNDRLKELWMRYFNAPPIMDCPKTIRTLWYKIQCENHNLRIKQKNITRLNRYSTNPNKYIEKSYKTKYHLRSGMEIVKTYQGRQYRILVRSPGEFVYDNQSYKSLSAVARAICNKKVSGYDFFGINNKHYEKNIVKDEKCKG
ncbi:MAG: DUF2924 domain-containing protein [Candidatus Eremiobacteraeota bacterium]|nr:DUF2924 domain-containing protein [Candidatus Eremiobacteraeota bacterium]